MILMVQLMKILRGWHKMCECYDPNGPKYCNIHKEMSKSKTNKSELESMINNFKGYLNKNQENY